MKILKLRWSQRNDSFHYTFQSEAFVIKKRDMLPLVMRIFDSPSPASYLSHHQFVNDIISRKRFLVDLGEEIFVSPPITGAHRASDIVLTIANGTRIATNEPKSLQQDLDLARQFFWTYDMADVA